MYSPFASVVVEASFVCVVSTPFAIEISYNFTTSPFSFNNSTFAFATLFSLSWNIPSPILSLPVFVLSPFMLLSSNTEQKFHEQTKCRDLAIMTLLLGTGIRVSECVGLDITDVDFRNNGIKVHRKGGAEVVVYFGDEVRTALLNYLEERNTIEAVEGSTNALFLSLQKKRIGVRAVENLVKKYSKLITTMKNITPHKLRSTYGTSLYRETGDIYLVADVLGHKDVNTTKKHYAALEDERRRTAPKYIHLRDE